MASVHPRTREFRNSDRKQGQTAFNLLKGALKCESYAC